jgi:hypothetical protein
MSTAMGNGETRHEMSQHFRVLVQGTLMRESEILDHHEIFMVPAQTEDVIGMAKFQGIE